MFKILWGETVPDKRYVFSTFYDSAKSAERHSDLEEILAKGDALVPKYKITLEEEWNLYHLNIILWAFTTTAKVK